MADISFHTLTAAGGNARALHACRMIEASFRAGERVLVWLGSPEELTRFDTLLWTFSDRAFVPHETLTADPGSCEAPVQLFAGAELDERLAGAGFDTLVYLHDAPAAAALKFDKVIEVLDADPACRNAGRARYRYYRDHGATPRHIEVTNDG